MSKPGKGSYSESRCHSKYKVRNWREYNEALRKRGDISLVIAPDFASGWNSKSEGPRKRGRPEEYSEKAILCCLQLRSLFGLKLRQTEGFVNWLFKLAGINLQAPDYSTLCKRAKELKFELALSAEDKSCLYICLDSTGLQIYSGNEWLENKHGKQYRRKVWKKLHIAVNEEGKIVAQTVTDHHQDDRKQVGELIENVTAEEAFADSGYDSEGIYNLLRKKGMKPVIRPPNQAKTSFDITPTTERQQHVQYQQEKGFHAWRNKHNYGRREKVENTFFRLKTIFGSKLLARNDSSIINEIAIKCQLLNNMFEIGKPNSIKTA